MIIINFLSFIFVGLLAGWLSGLLIKGRGFGCIGNILIGAIGGLIGGFVFEQFDVSFGGFIGSLLTAVVGALILVFVVTLLSRLLKTS